MLCLVVQLCPTLCDPMDCSPPDSSVHWGFSRQEYWSGLPCPPQGDLPNPGIKPNSPALQADSVPSEPPGNSKCIGVGSLSLLQGNFLTQKKNQGLLHCRQILYQPISINSHKLGFTIRLKNGNRKFLLGLGLSDLTVLN